MVMGGKDGAPHCFTFLHFNASSFSKKAKGQRCSTNATDGWEKKGTCFKNQTHCLLLENHSVATGPSIFLEFDFM